MTGKSVATRKRQIYKVDNWSEYNEALKARGSLEIWIPEDIAEHWYEADQINDGSGK